jgi:hypothetical protein
MPRRTKNATGPAENQARPPAQRVNALGYRPARSWPRSVPSANSEQCGRAQRWLVEGPCGLTFEFTRLRRLAKPAVAGRVQRRVSPWPDSLFGARLGVCEHARTVPEAMVQAQLADAPAVDGARRSDEVRSVLFLRQGAHSALQAARWFARRFRMRLSSVFPAAG